MFNVKKIEYVNKTFRMPAELVKTLEVIAQQQKISLNNLVVQCCEYALSNIDPAQTSAEGSVTFSEDTSEE